MNNTATQTKHTPGPGIICYKCNGTGYIDGFAHVANGRCFQCMGSGRLPEAKKKNIGYSRAFVKQFMQPGFFPEDQSGLKKVKCIGFEGHETAEKWLMINCGDYYLGQPVCRASGWYKIPVADFSEFAKHYKKAFKDDLTKQ
jgi:hypothetical protein